MKNQIIIDGETYVKKTVEEPDVEGIPYVMIRTRSAGVFAGYLHAQGDQTVTLKKARRIWYWSGAASLSELAMEGTSDPKNCKFPVEVISITLFEVIEIIPITDQAKLSIQEVPIWTMN